MSKLEDFLKKDISFYSDFVLTPSGDLDVISGLENLKNALYRRLLTTPGTLIHRPDYGVGIKDFQNSLNSLSNQQKLAMRIRTQFIEDPRVDDVTGVRVNIDANDPSRIEIFIRVSVIGYGETTFGFIPFGDA